VELLEALAWPEEVRRSSAMVGHVEEYGGKTMALTGGVAVGSSERLASTVEDVEAEVSADLDSNGRRRW
jgi:hypothetical protein